MALRTILIHPDPRLKRAAKPVETVDKAMRRLIADMFETMYDAPGVGLAAPQIGVDARVVVMDCAPKDGPREPLTMINPEVVRTSEELNEHEEGCLSLPDVYGLVTRPTTVGVRFLDETGKLVERDFDGLWATCAQHEIDHLNGRLFIDYLGAARRMMITDRMKKLKRERAKAAAH
ncbi:MAG: peptide deformylase [Rhodobacteraceae bacterium]|nr:MAG: peptide deformylase [Paracoccaceae bacterium]